MSLKETFFDLLFPHKCIVCEKIIDKSGLCENCKDKLEPVEDDACFFCGEGKDFCLCDRFTYRFDGLVSPYYNEGFAQEAVYKLKYMSDFRCIDLFSAKMAERVDSIFGLENIDIICFVPANRKTLMKRTFNQTELFANKISEIIGKSVDATILKKREFVSTQHELSLTDRFTNVRNAFYTTHRIDGKNVLLIDDIKTTGASLDECARQLKFAGAGKVYCATALVGRRKNKDD